MGGIASNPGLDGGDEMTESEIGRDAAAVGLALSPQQLEELASASALMRRLADLIPHDPPLAEEPALTLRLRRRDPR